MNVVHAIYIFGPRNKIYIILMKLIDVSVMITSFLNLLSRYVISLVKFLGDHRFSMIKKVGLKRRDVVALLKYTWGVLKLNDVFTSMVKKQ